MPTAIAPQGKSEEELPPPWASVESGQQVGKRGLWGPSLEKAGVRRPGPCCAQPSPTPTPAPLPWGGWGTLA